MRVVVVGATGNLGTSLLRSLGEVSEVEVVAVARRLPDAEGQASLPAAEWRAADMSSDDLTDLFRGADAVVHLGWLIQPSRDRAELDRVNIGGSKRLVRAVVDAGVPALLYASSVGAYSPGPREERVTEAWPVGGIASSYYSQQKVAVERELDRVEAEQPGLRVVRMRPALVFKGEAANGIRRLFAGPLLPGRLLGHLPLLPTVAELRFQCVHADDVARAFVAALLGDARGAFNLAAEPVLGREVPAELLGARPVPLPAAVARGAASLAWHARLTSVSPDWLDLGLSAPLLDTEAARSRLAWQPRIDSRAALAELLDGLRGSAEAPTPPLARLTSGRGRWREFATRLGGRDDVSG